MAARTRRYCRKPRPSAADKAHEARREKAMAALIQQCAPKNNP